MFNDAYHTALQSDRFWAGLLTDLIIEQNMMRSLKSRAGLTRMCINATELCGFEALIVVLLFTKQ